MARLQEVMYQCSHGREELFWRLPNGKWTGSGVELRQIMGQI